MRGQQTIRQLFRRTPVRFPVIAADRLLLCKCLRLRGEEAAAVDAVPCHATAFNNDSHYLTGIEPREGHLEHLSQLTNSIAPFSLPTPLPFPDLGGMDGKTFQMPWQMFPLLLHRGLLFFYVTYLILPLYSFRVTALTRAPRFKCGQIRPGNILFGFRLCVSCLPRMAEATSCKSPPLLCPVEMV